MKNLSYFLWLCVVSLAGYIVYFFATTTKWREQDLAMVERQKEALRVVSMTTHAVTLGYFNLSARLVELQGNTPKDIEFVNKGKTVLDSVHKAVSTMQKDAANNTWNTAYQTYINTTESISLIDTTLQELGSNYMKDYSHQLTYRPFQTLYWWYWHNLIHRIELRCIEKLRLLGGCGVYFFNRGKFVIPHSQVVGAGGFYEAQIGVGDFEMGSEIEMYVNKNSLRVHGNKAEIMIDYIPLQFNENGESKQSVNGKIIVKNVYHQDTTIYLSTTYTVKRKK